MAADPSWQANMAQEMRGLLDDRHLNQSPDTGQDKLKTMLAKLRAATAYTQTYSTADTTNGVMTAVAVATTAATNSSPYGYAQAQADAIVTNVNALVADVTQLKKLINSLIDDLQAAGIAG